MRPLSNYLQTLLGILIIPFIWFICADVLTLVNAALLPSLISVLRRFADLIGSGSIFADLGATVLRWLTGFSLGVFTGVLTGLILGLSPALMRTMQFPIEFFRAMPVTAIFPLFLIVFGIGDSSKIAMAFTPTFLLMTVNTSYGVTLAETLRRKMARVFGASSIQIFFRIVTMDALPQIFVGLRLSLSLSLVVTVVSEMFIGTDFGLGQRVYDSYLTNSVTTLYALLIALGLLGYFANQLMMFLERKAVFWKT